MTPVQKKLIAVWMSGGAACVAMASHQVLISYAFLLIGMLVRFSLPQLPLSKRAQLGMLAAVGLANIAFLARAITPVAVLLWTACGLIFAWLLVLGVRWDVRLFQDVQPARPSAKSWTAT
jgi:hypothetical protein